ncbi:MAG: membrane protein insertase YidC [Eubacteriales bacterium]|nr:membrane protein insertase YidC [Eubacteriales bacterium]
MSFMIQFFEQLIEWNYFFSHDYGIAIAMITLEVRLLLLPLNIRQRKQISRQQEISKKVESIRMQYKNNKEKQEKELAKFYQENGMGISGCITSLIQIPIMICLYNSIRHITAIECGTIVLPWVSSLLVRDQTFILPMATLGVQMLQYLYPRLHMFSSLKHPKQSGSTMVSLLIANSFFVFMIPAGIGLYYFVSGLFLFLEQFLYDWLCVRKLKSSKD